MNTSVSFPRRALIAFIATLVLILAGSSMTPLEPASASPTPIEAARAKVKKAREALQKARLALAPVQVELAAAEVVYNNAVTADAEATTAYIEATTAATTARAALERTITARDNTRTAKQKAATTATASQAAVKRAADALAEAKRQHASPARIAQLQKQLSTAKDRAGKATANLKRLTDKLADLVAQVATLRTAAQAADATARQADATMEQAAAALEDADAKLQVVDDKYTKLRAAVTGAEDALEAAKLKLEALKSKVVTQTIRVAATNIRFTLSDRQASRALDAVLDRGVDLVGVQEWKTSNRRQATPRIRKTGFSAYAPDRGDTIVLWRPSRYQALKSFTTQIARETYVGPVDGKKVSHHTRQMFAATVRLRDRDTGLVISMTSVHLPAHVSAGGRPRPGATLARVKQRLASEKALHKLVLAEKRAADLVFVAGDFNVDYRADRKIKYPAFTEYWMSKAGMVNAYDNPGGLPGNSTMGGVLYDGVYANIRAQGASVLSDANGSDHRPVVTSYKHRTHLK